MANVENPYQIALENNLVVTTNTIIENLPYRNFITVKFEEVQDPNLGTVFKVGDFGNDMGEIIKTYSEDNLTFEWMAITSGSLSSGVSISYCNFDAPEESKYYFSYDKDDKDNTLLWYKDLGEHSVERYAMYQPTNTEYFTNKIHNNIDNPITIVFDYKLYPDLPEYTLGTNFSFLTPYQNDTIDFSNISAENAAYRGTLQLNESMILITNATTPHPFELSFPKRTSNNTWDLSKTTLEYIDADGFDDTGEPILVDRAKPYLNMNDFYIRTDKLKEVQFMIVEYDVEVQSIGYMAEDTFSILQYLLGNKGYPMFSHTDNLSKTNYFWMGEANQYENPIYCICAYDKDSVKHFPTKIKFSNIIE